MKNVWTGKNDNASFGNGFEHIITIEEELKLLLDNFLTEIQIQITSHYNLDTGTFLETGQWLKKSVLLIRREFIDNGAPLNPLLDYCRY